MLAPKRVKYRKWHIGRLKGKDEVANKVSFGEFGLMAITSGRITARQIEAARVSINRRVKEAENYGLGFSSYSGYQKPAETRMGKGKGNPEFWVSEVRPGRVLFEMSGIDEAAAKKALTLASYKLPIHTEFVKRTLI